MKKTFLLILIASFVLSLCSFKSVTNEYIIEDNLKGNTDNTNSLYRYNTDYNDNISTAVNLTPTNYHITGSYKLSYNDVLETQNGLTDVDYYCFEVCGLSNITLKTSTSSQTSFKIILQYLNSSVSGNSLSTSLYDIYYDYSNDKIKTYKGQLDAGTYYLYLRGKESSLYRESINYNISLEITEQPRIDKEININNMLNENYIGFYYGLDYNHLKDVSFLDINKKIKIDNSYATDNYLINYLNNRKYECICIGSLYIYDLDTIKAFNDIITVIRDIHKNGILDNLKKQEEVKVIVNSVDFYFDVILEVAGIKYPVASKVVGYTKDLIVMFLDDMQKHLFDTISVKVLDYLSFMDGISAPSIGADKYIDFIKLPIMIYYDGSSITINPIDELLKIRKYLKISKDFKEYLIDTKTSIRCTECFFISDGRCDTCDKFIVTKYKSKIRYFNSREQFMDLNTYLDNINYNYISIEEQKHYHNFTYNYIDNKKHECICRCGYKIITGHCLNKPTDKYCSQCGGYADMGLIGPNLYKRYNNNINTIYFKRW